MANFSKEISPHSNIAMTFIRNYRTKSYGIHILRWDSLKKELFDVSY